MSTGPGAALAYDDLNDFLRTPPPQLQKRTTPGQNTTTQNHSSTGRSHVHIARQPRIYAAAAAAALLQLPASCRALHQSFGLTRSIDTRALARNAGAAAK